jgi:formylglycine-generating enzyme required for sulfatase activity
LEPKEKFMSTKPSWLLVVAAFVAGGLAVSGQTSLEISPAGNQFILHWPPGNSGTNGVLQSSTELAAGNWLAATDAVPASYTGQVAVAVARSSAGRFFRLSYVPPTTNGLALVPAGTFTIGDSLDGTTDAVPTNVYVSSLFMDTNLVTYGKWQAVYTYATNHGYGFDSPGFGKATNQPVHSINWYDAVKWCNARSQQAGLTPVYYTDAAFTQVYTNSENDAPYVNWAANGYRLPTEAEWEKAARGGLNGLRFPWGNTITESQANYYSTNLYSYDLGPNGYNPAGNSGANPKTTPAGYFPANNFGICDMAGNVYEWNWDWYSDHLSAAGSPYAGGNDPRGPASSPYACRVIRGGCWANSAPAARCASRSYSSPIAPSNLVGFRCVRSN